LRDFSFQPFIHTKDIIMNFQQSITVLALVVAGSAASAIEATQTRVPATGLTRAEVQAELARARANGELLSDAQIEQQPFGTMASTLTRAEVQAELARARANGELLSDAQIEQQPFAAVATSRSRDEVRREALASVRAPFNPLYVGG
jgi:hypothetical protein